MRSGFTLIELVVGLFLSSLIAVSLYNSFFVTSRVVSVADTFITTDFRASLVENQFERDFSGIFIPEQPDTAQTSTVAAPQVQEKKEAVEKKEEQKPAKPIDKIFYTVNGQQDSLQVLTFITNNPIKKYEKATNVQPRVHVVRVVYRLLPQEDDPQSFSLVRQESQELDFDAFDLKTPKVIRAYELATGIKSITCEYRYPIKQEEPQQQKGAPQQKELQAKTEEKPKPEYKTVKVWDVDTKKEENKEQPKIPEFITCTIDFWDNQKREERFVFEYGISTFAAQMAPKKQKKAASPKPSHEKKTESESAKKENEKKEQTGSHETTTGK